jgi:hypothetical protein
VRRTLTAALAASAIIAAVLIVPRLVRGGTTGCAGQPAASTGAASPNASTGSVPAEPDAGARALSLTSGDGLQLGLGDHGSVTDVNVGSRRIPTTTTGQGGFELRMVGGSPNLLADPGLEEDRNGDGVPDGWRFLGGGASPVLDDQIAHGGRCSIRISNSSISVSGALAVDVPVTPLEYYVVSAWMRGDDILPTRTTASFTPARLAVQQLAGGKVVDTSFAFGYTNTSDWNRQFVGFHAGPDVTQVRLEGLIDEGSGTVWFDDLYLGRLFQEPGWVPVTGALTAGANAGLAEQRADLKQLGLHLDVRYSGGNGRIAVQGTISGTTTSDRAFQLRYTLPLRIEGWRWGEDARTDVRIESGSYDNDSVTTRQSRRYAYGGINQLQQTSTYPFAAVYDDRSSLALGVPLSDPRMFRIDYDASTGLSITFDLGTSPAAKHLNGAATFSFVIYTADPAWGFRAATEKYYQLFPSSFVRRTQSAREGIWFFAPPLDSLASSWREFGLGLDVIALGKAPTQSHSTWGTAYVPWDDRRNIYDSAYTHEWAYFQPRGSPETPTYDQALARMQSLASSHPVDAEGERARDEALAALRSTERDVNGRLYYETYRDFFAFYQNLDSLPSAPLDWTRAVQAHQVDAALKLAQGAGGSLAGIHLDSTSGMRRWGAVDDYDRAHWAATSLPLTFSYNSGRVAERGVLAMYEQIQRVASFVHDRGMILSANFNGGDTRAAGWLGADQIDYFGVEQGLPERASGADGIDRLALLKRSLAYDRPVSTLDTRIADGSLTLPQIERRLQQNLFYDIYAGAWVRDENEDHQTIPSWSTPDRAALYARYTHLFRTLGTAGWQPVTEARSSNPDVWVERYGCLCRGDLRLTVRNETTATQHSTLTIDLRAEGATAAAALEEITGTALQVTVDRAQGTARISLTVPPETTQLIRVTRSS